MFGKKLNRKFAMNTDLMYVRAWAGNYFKIKDMNAVDLKYRTNPEDCWETIDFKEMTKNLDYFGIKYGTEIIFEEKEGEKNNETNVNEQQLPTTLANDMNHIENEFADKGKASWVVK